MHRLLSRTIVAAALTLATVASADSLTKADAESLDQAIKAICPLLVQEAAEVQLIAEERQNPAGVISLRRLHELGQVLAETRSQLALARQENAEGERVFARLSKKRIDLGFCESWQEKHPEDF